MTAKSKTFQGLRKRSAQALSNVPCGVAFVALALSITLSACAPQVGSNTSASKKGNSDPWGDAPVDDPVDMVRPVPIGDLGVPNPITSGMTGCKGYGACIGNCNNGSAANYDQCSAQCDQKASAQAMSLLNSAFMCGINACISQQQCSSTYDMSDTCTICAYDAVAAMFGSLSCSSGGAICNTSACTTKVSACMASTP